MNVAVGAVVAGGVDGGVVGLEAALPQPGHAISPTASPDASRGRRHIDTERRNEN